MEKENEIIQKNYLCHFYIVFFSSCSRTYFLTDENISDFENISDLLFTDDTTRFICRDLEDISRIYAEDSSCKEIPVNDLYCKFFQDKPELCMVHKYIKDLKSLAENYSTRNISKGVLEIKQGARLLMEKLPDGNDNVELIFFYKYGYIPMLGNTRSGNAYVYSPYLDLSSLSSCELAVFGLDYAHETKYKNWFYTAPLG